MAFNESGRLVWIDLEMTGLNPDFDRIIEIATVITNYDLNIISEGPVLAIHQNQETLEGMDAWNQRTHQASGLIEQVRKSKINEMEAEQFRVYS